VFNSLLAAQHSLNLFSRSNHGSQMGQATYEGTSWRAITRKFKLATFWGWMCVRPCFEPRMRCAILVINQGAGTVPRSSAVSVVRLGRPPNARDHNFLSMYVGSNSMASTEQGRGLDGASRHLGFGTSNPPEILSRDNWKAVSAANTERQVSDGRDDR